ncbi:MAG TPA: 7-carboxy-7-deazaguanine synthase QueE [Gammaproteobacteria bacterium]|nr:7-carboxy-7-deazaguanine synthase QueE [Gammaproteobacteria bacterium]
MSPAGSLRVAEIFYSLQGESRSAGFPTVFVRLTGCPLRCGYCDTHYAFRGGEEMSLNAIISRAAEFDTGYVTVTGGEPLAQAHTLGLLAGLCDAGFTEVSLETCGALDISSVDQRVVKVMDLKTPGSGEMERNCYENILHLGCRDQVKFVLCNRADYDWAKRCLAEYELVSRCEVLFSPAANLLEPVVLADWILEDRLTVRFQLQLHKLLWGNEPGR